MPAPVVAARDAAHTLRAAGAGAGRPVGLAVGGSGVGLAAGDGGWWVPGDPAATVAALSAELRPRWVWWSARLEGAALVRAGLRVTSCWDVAAAHRLQHGGASDDPERVWAEHQGLPPGDRPVAGQLDLRGFAGPGDSDDLSPPDDPDDPVGPDGYLRPDWPAGSAAGAPAWAALALRLQAAQQRALQDLPDRRPAARPPALPVLTAWSESAAELLAVELAAGGLPLDRATATELIAAHAGARPMDEPQAAAARAARDDVVRREVRDADDLDLRNPAQVRELLSRVGIDVPDTRSWRLERLRAAHPVVPALLAWRKSERIATTYGYGWLDRSVGPDGRLRGDWHGCDGAAGRMTAQAGLHNLPAELRAAVAAEPGKVLVRADLGQIEPRVLAAVSGDPALAAATADPDLYSPVAARLRCDRPTAKVAVLAAMYGQTSGTAGQALLSMDAAYPVAMAFLRAADEEGRAGRHVRTYGGRLVRMWSLPDPEPAAVAGRGRFARNAVVQGAAAELFKMWAVTVRAALPAATPDGEVVLCLHDELLVQVPEAAAGAVVALLHRALDETTARWAAGSGVRLVADVSVLARWSEAKG